MNIYFSLKTNYKLTLKAFKVFSIKKHYDAKPEWKTNTSIKFYSFSF